MALSEFTKKLVETKLEKFCRGKISEMYRDRLILGFRIEGDRVTVFEERRFLFDSARSSILDVAQFRYSDRTNRWTLYYKDADSAWHEYYLSPKLDFELLLREVDEDPLRVFWDERILFLDWN
ncbi:MAG: DUF3024 domain-containing protein [Syntrophales bacterium]|nr:DUF3024 domain-containing protein [Syntrophales bacterium]MDD5232673.1 DUF3024 domain-containing protein [Syntrophales bacterium]MDD5533952.1 DUF3024 domain-containing protein [Syntrophales bacterium]